MPRPTITERRCCCAKALPIAPGEVPVMKVGLPVQEFLPHGRAPQSMAMFRSDNQDAVGAREFVLEAHHLGRKVAFIVHEAPMPRFLLLAGIVLLIADYSF